MTSHITTEDREAAENSATVKFKHGYEAYDEQKRDGFLEGIEYVRSQPESEFQKGVASVQSQLTEARERLRVVESAMINFKCIDKGGHLIGCKCFICEALAQIQEPNGKKGG